ncbi:hypothetical protein [Pseudoclavibacter sp. 13-3]|uniref:hypothetical protein n=1 Tax=Pseudoclavibacter sp. 13-3 TaxID=2901228 RepID=UPI001E324963|nr:hypothetical protein [Pseudoclavibacter sp. 13-3]MCD7101295.1 hypothetical protein [Pseudoclavibacter sp. 13-3]
MSEESSAPSNGENGTSAPKPQQRPPLQARAKPYEIVSLAGVFSVFAAAVVMIGTRSVTLTATAFGIAFIVVLVVFATLALTVKPDQSEKQEIEREQRQREIDEAIRQQAARIEAQTARVKELNDQLEAQRPDSRAPHTAETSDDERRTRDSDR